MANKTYDVDIQINPDWTGAEGAKRSFRDTERGAAHLRGTVSSTNEEISAMGPRSRAAATGLAGMAAAMRATQDAGGGMNRMMKHMIGYITAFAGYGIMKNLLQGFGEWEMGLVNIAKTTNMAEKEVKKLGHEILQIARDAPISANALTGLAAAAGQVGVKGVEDLQKFSKTVADLTIASNLYEEEAVFALKKTLDLTKENVDQVDILASVWVRLGNNFAVTERQIANGTREVAKALSIYNISSAHVSGIATALAASGMAPEISRGVMIKTFGRLNKAMLGDDALLGKVSGVTGTPGDRLKELWSSGSQGKIEIFLSLIKGLQGEGERAALAMENLGLSGLRVLPVLGGLASVYDTVLAPAMEHVNDEVEKGTALQEEVGKFYNAFLSQMKTVAHVVGEAADLMGEQMAPAALRAGHAFKDWVIQLLESNKVMEAGQKIGRAMNATFEQFGRIISGTQVLIGVALIKPFMKLFHWIDRSQTGLAMLAPLMLKITTIMKTSGFLVAMEALNQRNEYTKLLEGAQSVGLEIDRSQLKQHHIDRFSHNVLEAMAKIGAAVAALFQHIWDNFDLTKLLALFLTMIKEIGLKLYVVMVEVFERVKSDLIPDLFNRVSAIFDFGKSLLRLDMEGMVRGALGVFGPSQGASDKLAALAKQMDKSLTTQGTELGQATAATMSEGLSKMITAFKETSLPQSESMKRSESYLQSIKDILAKADAENPFPAAVKKSLGMTGGISQFPTVPRYDFGEGHLGKINKTLFGFIEGEEYKNLTGDFEQAWEATLTKIGGESQNLFMNMIPDYIGDTVVALIDGTASMGDALKGLARIIGEELVRATARWIAQMLIARAISMFFGNMFAGAPTGPVSTGPSGGVGIGGPAPYGNFSILGGATGGLLTGRGGPTQDNIPTLLSNGEFVTNAKSTQKFLPLLEAINNFTGGGGAPVAPSAGGSHRTQVTLVDQRVKGSPDLDFRLEEGLNNRQVSEVKLYIMERIQDTLRTGEMDAQFQGAYGAVRRPVNR